MPGVRREGGGDLFPDPAADRQVYVTPWHRNGPIFRANLTVSSLPRYPLPSQLHLIAMVNYAKIASS
jgi:hypothetical protein